VVLLAFFVVVYCDGIPDQVERKAEILLQKTKTKKSVQNLKQEMRKDTILLEKTIKIIALV
jgi:hypothetical protein